MITISITLMDLLVLLFSFVILILVFGFTLLYIDILIFNKYEKYLSKIKYKEMPKYHNKINEDYAAYIENRYIFDPGFFSINPFEYFKRFKYLLKTAYKIQSLNKWMEKELIDIPYFKEMNRRKNFKKLKI